MPDFPNLGFPAISSSLILYILETAPLQTAQGTMIRKITILLKLSFIIVEMVTFQ